MQQVNFNNKNKTLKKGNQRQKPTTITTEVTKTNMK